MTTSYHPHFNNISVLQNQNHFTDGNGEYCGEGINAHELQLEIQKEIVDGIYIVLLLIQGAILVVIVISHCFYPLRAVSQTDSYFFTYYDTLECESSVLSLETKV